MHIHGQSCGRAAARQEIAFWVPLCVSFCLLPLRRCVIAAAALCPSPSPSIRLCPDTDPKQGIVRSSIQCPPLSIHDHLFRLRFPIVYGAGATSWLHATREKRVLFLPNCLLFQALTGSTWQWLIYAGRGQKNSPSPPLPFIGTQQQLRMFVRSLVPPSLHNESISFR